MSENQLPQWAIDAGWTEQDVADGWFPQVWGDGAVPVDEVDDGEPPFLAYKCQSWSAICVDDESVHMRSWKGARGVDDYWHAEYQFSEFLDMPSPAAARQCALDIVAAVKRARGEQG